MKQKSGITSVHLGEKLQRQLKIEAATQGISASAFIRQLLTAWLECKKEKQQKSRRRSR